eukprot:gene11063-12896_t
MCSDHDKNFPSGLLFVPGQDGRNNKGSVTVLKYLFCGSVLKDLFDETVESAFEPLEEIVFLVKATSLSVIWSHEMKALLSPLMDSVPFLIEYLSTAEEEVEIDLLQARKCADFKRMMLESVCDGEGVGIPIPIGYDDIQDIESWPMLQAFALDHVYCPTGFFTARYNVADITAHLEVIFRTVDGYYVENAIRTMNRSIGPHMVQAICMLDASSGEQRMRVSADDVVGPLEILYDFGEMEAAGTVDATTQPVVLFGPDTAQFGAVAGAYPAGWKDQLAGKALHAILEGCEPSSGLRWCRTYFLQRGRTAAQVDVSDDLLANNDAEYEDNGDETYRTESKHSNDLVAAGKVDIDHGLAESLERLEGLYVKLLLALRLVVKIAFARHNDVLEAGTEVQRKLDALMKGTPMEEGSAETDAEGLDIFTQEQWASLRLDTAALRLRPEEQLQVHMDCLNAVGEIVTIEDVDDMGGSCWTYIRVAVHGIHVTPYGKNPATVAVGDTFLFSSHRSALAAHVGGSVSTHTSGSAHPSDRLLLQGDGCCITHPLPYYRCLLGAGAEEQTSRRLLACTKSIHMSSTLGLGKPLDYTGTGLLSLTVLTDHPVMPHFEAELRTFTEGLLVEKIDGASCLPLLMSLGQHVDRVWTVDTADCLAQASKLFAPFFLKERGLPDIDVPSGIIIVFRLKGSEDVEPDALNPLERSLPLIGSTGTGATTTGGFRHLALIVPNESRSSSAVSSALSHWRTALRMHDVQEHRGGQEVALPDAILRAVLSLLDFWSEGVPNTVAATDTSSSSSTSFEKLSSALVAKSAQDYLTTALSFAKVPTLQIPGAGYYALKCVHSVSDAHRVSGFDFASLGAAPMKKNKKNQSSTELIVLVGQAGSGVSILSTNLTTQLKASATDAASAFHAISIDFSELPEAASYEAFEQFLAHRLVRPKQSAAVEKEVLFVSVVQSAVHYLPMQRLMTLLSVKLRVEASVVMSMLAPSSLDIASHKYRYASKTVNETGHGLGHEYWQALGYTDAVQGAAVDVLLLVDESASSGADGAESAAASFRRHLAVANPTAQIVKLSPNHLRLDQESLDLVLSISQAGRGSNSVTQVGTERQAWWTCRGGPRGDQLAQLPTEAASNYVQSLRTVRHHTPAMVDTGLTAVHLQPSSEWNLRSVLQTIQLIFPSVKLSSSVAEETWKVPAKQPTGPADARTRFFKRVIQLAKAKVMCARQEEEGRRVYQQTVGRLSKTKATTSNGKAAEDVLQRLIRGVRSVHGVLQLPTGAVVINESATPSSAHSKLHNTSNKALLEGNTHFAVLRALPAGSGVDAGRTVGLVVHGVLGKQEVALLEELFAACTQFKLHPKALLSAEEVGLAERLRVQNLTQYSSLFELPGNWWFDGQSYVDISGTRRPLRPDIDKLVDLYLVNENAKIVEYNAMLKDI